MQDDELRQVGALERKVAAEHVLLRVPVPLLLSQWTRCSGCSARKSTTA
jgi:hypothetical protein